jgi:hypothetical protein
VRPTGAQPSAFYSDWVVLFKNLAEGPGYCVSRYLLALRRPLLDINDCFALSERVGIEQPEMNRTRVPALTV